MKRRRERERERNLLPAAMHDHDASCPSLSLSLSRISYLAIRNELGERRSPGKKEDLEVETGFSSPR